MPKKAPRAQIHVTPVICRMNGRADAGWPWHRWSDVRGTSGRTAFRASHSPLCRWSRSAREWWRQTAEDEGGTAAADRTDGATSGGRQDGTGGISGEPTGYGGTTQREANRYRQIRRGTSTALRLSLCRACRIRHLELPLGFQVELCGTFSYSLGSEQIMISSDSSMAGSTRHPGRRCLYTK